LIRASRRFPSTIPSRTSFARRRKF